MERGRDETGGEAMGAQVGVAVKPVVTTLSNGITVGTAVQPTARTVALELRILAGAALDPPGSGGLAHGLEHLMGRATPQLHAALDRSGISVDWSTDEETMSVSALMLPTAFKDAVSILSELVCRPSFDGVDVELRIVHAEVAHDFDDADQLVDPTMLIAQRLLGEPWGSPVAGTPASVRALTSHQLLAAHARYVTGANIILSIAGPLDVDSTLRTIGASGFASLPPGQRIPLPPIVPPAQAGPSLVWSRDGGGERVKIAFGFRCPGRAGPPPTQAALDVLRALLDGGESARLPQLRTARGRAYDMSAELHEAGLLLIHTDADRRELVDAVWDILADVVTDLAANGPSRDELLRCKALLALDAASAVETPESAAARLAGTLQGVAAASPVEHAARMLAVSARDVARLARQVVQADRLAIVLAGDWTEADRREVQDAVDDAVSGWWWEPSRVAELAAAAQALVSQLPQWQRQPRAVAE